MELLNVNSGDKIAVAVSGGKDSMCLLYCLNNLKSKLNIELIAVNVDHGIRGEESRKDSEFVKNYCEKLGVFLYFEKVDVPQYCKRNNLSIEEGARILRYGVFKKVLDRFKGYKIATAHHKNDLFESVLFNLFRGTGLKGLKGIDKVTDVLVRPLINSSREEIDSFAAENNVPFVVDKTNFDTDYARNYLRHEIIPLIKDKFPSALNSVYRLTETISEDDDFIQKSAEKLVFLYKKNYAVPTSGHPSVLKRAIIIAMNKSGLIKDYEKTHVDCVYELINKQNGSKVTLPQSITAIRSYDKITFYKAKANKLTSTYPFKTGEYNFDTVTAVIEKTETKKPNVLNFCLDEFLKLSNKTIDDLEIRTRNDGDVFQKFGGGTKKLKDYFIDKKIPQNERDSIPLLVCGNEALVVFGVEISEKVKVLSGCKNIYTASLK